MSSLNYYSSIFTTEQLAKLRHRNIITIMDFLQESPESISKMMNLRFKVSHITLSWAIIILSLNRYLNN